MCVSTIKCSLKTTPLLVCLCVFKVPRRCPVLWMRSQVTLFCHSSPAKWAKALSSSGRKTIKKSQTSPKEWWLRMKAASKTTHTHTHKHTNQMIKKAFWNLKKETSICFYLSLCVSFHGLHCSSKLIFKNADKEDFGVFSVSVTHTEGVSSSYSISSEGIVCP